VVEEKVNNIRSKLELRIEKVEKELKRQNDRIESLSTKVKTEHQYKQKENYSEFSEKKGINFLIIINFFTDYLFLPNSLVSMLTHFSITGTDRYYIPMFSQAKLFLVDLRLDNKVVIQLYCGATPVYVWRENEAIG